MHNENTLTSVLKLPTYLSSLRSVAHKAAVCKSYKAKNYKQLGQKILAYGLFEILKALTNSPQCIELFTKNFA